VFLEEQTDAFTNLFVCVAKLMLLQSGNGTKKVNSVLLERRCGRLIDRQHILKGMEDIRG